MILQTLSIARFAELQTSCAQHQDNPSYRGTVLDEGDFMDGSRKEKYSEDTAIF